MAQEQDQICPFCFTIYPSGTLDPDVPVCRECNTFGRAMILVEYSEFRQTTSLAQLNQIRQTWFHRSNFLEAEREMVLTNLDYLITEIQNEEALAK